MPSDEVQLTLRAEVPTESEDLARMSGMVADHLKRFAFREELAVVWVGVCHPPS